MSMEDILKVLVNSRQQGNSSPQTDDPMTQLIGGLLVGVQQPQVQAPSQSTGLSDMMGLLEMVMGSSSASPAPSNMAGNPIMMLLQPYVEKLARKMKIPPEIAMTVVSFVAYKLLAHHPTSGRDSNSFDLDDLLNQMNTGRVDQRVFQDSGMVRELSKSTGLDEATAAQTLDAAFQLFGKQIKTAQSPTRARPSASGGKMARTASLDAKAGAKKRRG